MAYTQRPAYIKRCSNSLNYVKCFLACIHNSGLMQTKSLLQVSIHLGVPCKAPPNQLYRVREEDYSVLDNVILFKAI